MPDYNPAIAAGIQVPQTNWAGTLGTVANIQAEQARTNLYTLQAMQQQRAYNALMSGAAEMRASGDPRRASQAVLDNGGGPEIANQFMTYGANVNAISAAGGVTPTERNTLSAIPGTIAESGEKQTKADAEVAKTYGPAVLLNPSDDGAWRQQVLAHARAVQGTPNQMSPVEIGAALNVKDPNMRREAAIRYGVAAGVPLDKMTEVFGSGGAAAGDTSIDDYNNKNLTPAQRAGAAPILRQPGEVTQAKAQADATVKYLQEEGNKKYSNAASLKGSLVNMQHDIETLGPSWMGTGAEAKVEMVKGLNSVLSNIGLSPIETDKVSSWEEFAKETSRAGMQLINSYFGGSREAASIIQMGRGAVPAGGSSYLGAKYVAATIAAANQREMDLYEYQAAHSNQLPAKSAIAFNKANPPEDYAMRGITSVIPDAAKQHLITHPELRAAFDQKYGIGTAEFLLPK